MLLFPAVPSRLMKDHCSHCEKTTPWVLERMSLDFASKTAELYLYCETCHDVNIRTEWKRVVALEIHDDLAE